MPQLYYLLVLIKKYISKDLNKELGTMIKRYLRALKKLYLSITAEVEIKNKLDFLCGLRGILALNVVLAHHFYDICLSSSLIISDRSNDITTIHLKMDLFSLV